MKIYSLILMTVAILFFSCKKDIALAPAAEEIALSAKPDEKGNIKTRIVANTLNYPWEIVWGPDNYIWFTEREGRVKRINPATGQIIPVATIAEVTSTTNFNGLMGMALHPQFSTNPYVYLVYNYFDASSNYLEKVVRFTYNGTTLVSPMTLVDGIIGKIGGDFIHKMEAAW